MPERSTVAILGSYAPSLINFRGKLIEELVARGYDVLAMAPDISEAIAQELHTLGATPLQVQLAKNPLNPLQLAACLRSLTATLRAARPAAIICYTIQPATIGALAASLAGVPRIVPLITGLGYPFSQGGGWKRRVSRLGAIFLFRLGLAKSSVVVFQNPDDRADLLEAGAFPPGKPSAIVNGSGVDLQHFSPTPLPDDPSFLMIARLTRDKGVFEFAGAARRLKQTYPRASFALAGWRDHSPACISERELERIVEDGVDYLGKLEDVRPAISNANVFVLPSAYREGTPRSILEAMATGRPVITTDAPGCRETVVEGQNGFLVPPCNERALCLAMEKFIVDPLLSAKMGERSREIAEQKFDVHKVNRALLQAAGL